MAEFTREEILAKVAAGESREGANLTGAHMVSTDFSGADLSEAKLSENTMSMPKYKSYAKYDKKTQWPEGFDPVAAGAVLVKMYYESEGG